MNSLYVMGGQQRYLRPFMADDRDWYEYEKGVILEVSPETRDSRIVVEYAHPPEIRELHGHATLFKSGAIRSDVMYACTQTEILIYQLPDFQQIGYISLPSFNDVHHVRPTSDGTLLVASSGLDMVQEITIDGGRVVREWSSLEEPIWSYFSKDVDYRPISTKPHRSHPNHLFFIDGELWTTRFCQKDAISLEDRSRRIEIGVGSPHDGLEYERLYLFHDGERVHCYRKQAHAEDGRNSRLEPHPWIRWPTGVVPRDPYGWTAGMGRIFPDPPHTVAGERGVDQAFFEMAPTSFCSKYGSRRKGSQGSLAGRQRISESHSLLRPHQEDLCHRNEPRTPRHQRHLQHLPKLIISMQRL